MFFSIVRLKIKGSKKREDKLLFTKKLSYNYDQSVIPELVADEIHLRFLSVMIHKQTKSISLSEGCIPKSKPYTPTIAYGGEQV
jgi:hypothetical protein